MYKRHKPQSGSLFDVVSDFILPELAEIVRLYAREAIIAGKEVRLFHEAECIGPRLVCCDDHNRILTVSGGRTLRMRDPEGETKVHDLSSRSSILDMNVQGHMVYFLCTLSRVVPFDLDTWREQPAITLYSYGLDRLCPIWFCMYNGEVFSRSRHFDPILVNPLSDPMKFRTLQVRAQDGGPFLCRVFHGILYTLGRQPHFVTRSLLCMYQIQDWKLIQSVVLSDPDIIDARDFVVLEHEIYIALPHSVCIYDFMDLLYLGSFYAYAEHKGLSLTSTKQLVVCAQNKIVLYQ
jgi:hypothetical protein